ncbi:2-aminomuconic semialdehyde dehydrogenase-like isoform X2 [Portunus trituberculatus]|uniref:2-aminomuconic semialdehyde dehydrogenase-like isoform X2 n=1 Tax=Portunus trituberculatus TaxID=210409 RepID=UPI001E1CB6BF|nr:2-aminomuconic semialdehyde dehydrogenase-like isoform X2 [Portunus trituberculatus]XP_045131048.1 2-aminomuconic semialdehyde dehydrogenase-like isoform X2 [Portunus trituberculatus]
MANFKTIQENQRLMLSCLQSSSSGLGDDVEDVLPAPTLYLSSFGGHSLGDAVRRIFKKLGTNSVWSFYSLKGKKGKLPFSDLPICKVIIRACMRTYKEAKTSAVEHQISEALKHAPKRKGGQKYKVKMDKPMVINNFIGGVMVPCQDHIDSHDPSTGLVWTKIPDSGQAEVDAAVVAAQAAFERWSSKSAQTRANHLLKVADILESRLEEFAVAESRDQGKPVWLARTIDIPRCVLNLRHFAHAIPHHLNTSNVNPEMGVVNYTLREPQGVAGLISPWNLPLYLLTFKLAPALMCGNTVVAKPSEMTSVTAYMFCKVLQDADFPAGVVNMVFGRGPSAGQALITHPQVPLVSFTGSTLTGKLIAQATAPMFKKLSLEMGGKNAAVVFDDCDMESCITTLKRSSFINSGQVCLCTSRIFVQKSLFKDFLEKFTTVAREVKVGPPSDKDVFMGPLNSKPHLDKVLKYISYAVEDGGQVLCGHGVDILDLPSQNKEGYFMKPTIITGLSDESRCMQEEIFGPVTCVTPFDTEEEVISRVNDTPYGLCASVFTSNLARGHRVAHKLKVGTVWTNCWLVRDLDMPFGGVKKSGLGRESTQESLEFYTEAKTVCIKI